tara:strand:- start:2498 stop:2860 length:363 start_codon:yes stop_codon:yes gene_type:complete
MATLTPTLTLTSSNLTSDSLSVSVTDSLSIAGDVIQKRIATSTSSAAFFTASGFNKCYVFLKNIDATDTIEIEKADGGDEFMSLAPGEFAFFPWDGTLDMFADATANTPVLEVMIFEATA